jgi:hypothetical protein
MSLLVSFLYLCLHIAVLVFVAYVIVWLLKWLGIGIDPQVYRVGQIIVALLIIIAVVLWAMGELNPSGSRLLFLR